MLRKFYYSLTNEERLGFCKAIGATKSSIQNKYMSPNPELRKKPSHDRFAAMLLAANEISPNSINREELAAYFYAAPDQT
tara:strand:- start:1922 stop:2161 length:240 start_codon:yes stop_codon:yes gene_type:complete